MKSAKVEDAAVLCLVVGVMMYLNTLDCGLCFDDEKAIIKNRDLRSDTPWTNLIWNDFWGTPMSIKTSHKSYRPLCVATFRLNYLLHELQPMGYHLVNVFLHGAVCYLYVQLCGVVFSQVWPALIAGLLFAVHPIHTEAVAGVVGRADVLSALFFLACILSYRRCISCRVGAGYYTWMAVALISCSCSALCKELGITAVALCFVWDCLFVQKWHIQRFTSAQQFLKSLQRPFLVRILILFSYAITFVAFRLNIMKGQPLIGHSLNPAAWQPTPYRQLHWAYLCFYNVWLLLCPAHLSPDYSMGTIPLITSLVDHRNLLTILMFSSVVVPVITVFRCRRIRNQTRNMIFAFGMMLTIIPFVPASNLFFPVGFVVAERVLYLPSMGFCMLVAYGSFLLISSVTSHHLRIILGSTLVLLLLLHSVRTVERNRAWVSEELLYHEAIRTYPRNAKMLHNLGVRVAGDDLILAEKLFRMSAKVEPKYVSALSDLGLVLSRQNKLQEAEEMYWKAVNLTFQNLNGDKEVTSTIKSLKVFTRLSKLLKQNSSRLQEAHQLCENITTHLSQLQVDYPKIYAEKGDILFRLEQYRSARVAVNTALKQDPGNFVAIKTLSKLQAQQGNVTSSEQVLRRALAKYGHQLPLVLEMASHLLRHHHDNVQSMKEAEYLLRQILLADSMNIEALLTLGQIYSVSVLLQPSKAIDLFHQVLQKSPSHGEAMVSLAKVYAQQNQCREATDVVDRLLKREPTYTQFAKKLLEAC